MIETTYITHENSIYKNAKVVTAYWNAPNEQSPVEICSLIEDIEKRWVVKSHLSRTTSEWSKSFESYGHALKEYYRRIFAFLEYKFPKPLFEE